MSKPHASRETTQEKTGRSFPWALVLSVLLVVAGIAWIAYYYAAVRVDPGAVPPGEPGSPAFMADLGRWNYLIGFGALLLGLAIASAPSTPLGRGNGVVVGMLGSFLVGLVWICTFYIFSGEKLEDLWVFNDLGNYNLMVGIAFMAVGFTYATKWE
ncbi:cell division protein CrgA [Nocardioides solisilvae]|uniref:cell division protein CrgA n=1 Tax=Nocardioides solisilvae TaxID=1542435 RepID=UPI000D741CEE|nr:cell division protein CrgA [Nocardioides solisilvae]